ncbi:MAG: GDSL-type esterase/lipase family protein [Planctomycetota bacterium]
METARAPARTRLARTWMWAWLAGLVALTLAWHDVLPGGYRLRSYVEPDSTRQTRENQRHARERWTLFEAANATTPAGAIAFVGSSTIERFPLAACFPAKPCANRGIAFESAAALAQRMPRTLPESPAGIVLYSGTIDFHEHGAEPHAIVRSLEIAVHRIRERSPGVPIALIGVMPRREMSTTQIERLRTLIDALRSFASRSELAYVDTLRPPFTSPRGDLAEEVSTDRYHLDARGYDQLARWILEDGGKVGQILAP